MAPHALIDLHDVSGYNPSQRFLEELMVPPSSYRKSKPYLTGVSALSSKASPKATVIGTSEAPNESSFWRLSLEEISEIEDSIRYFQRTCEGCWWYATD